MPVADPAAKRFLATRRSVPVRMLGEPAPDPAALDALLTSASRVPDHGKLEPWRFVVVEPGALPRIATAAAARAAALGMDDGQAAKARSQFDDSALAVVVVACPRASEKVPLLEQTLSAGAVCLGLLNAATAAGWGACWLTGWVAHDRAFAQATLGLRGEEFVAGIIHLGTPRGSGDGGPPDRPRPDVAALTTRIEA